MVPVFGTMTLDDQLIGDQYEFMSLNSRTAGREGNCCHSYRQSLKSQNGRVRTSVGDGTGGALVMWTDCRSYSDANACYANADVYAQDVDASGNSLWQNNGYALLADLGNQGVQYYVYTPMPPVVSIRLKSGDILAAWPDGRDNPCFPINPSTACDVYVERLKF